MRYALRVSALVVLLAGLSVPASAGEGDTLISDPDILARFGFPAEARNVYLAKGVELDRPAQASTPKEFGIVDIGITTIAGNQHSPRESSTYASPVGQGDISLVSGDIFYDGQFHMPEGALWDSASYWAVDSNAQDLQFVLFSVCQLGGPPTVTFLGAGGTGGSPGQVIVTIPLPANTTINNAACFYVARTRFNAASSDLSLQKVRTTWRRQVSPAPATATFPNDVSTSHPYFRFIEALANAGITSGCAPQSFCPDNPITRGEMAVFLSAALGLHWP